MAPPYQDWEAGGRWQVAGGQGRTSAALAVAGRVWAPDFYRVAGRTGRRNTMRLGLSRWPARGIRLSRGTMTRLFLYMRCILSIYARGGVLILPCLKVSRCRYLVPQTRRRLFSVAAGPRYVGAESTQVSCTWVLRLARRERGQSEFNPQR